MKTWAGTALSLAVAAGGIATLAWATDGWTVWTAEAARRQAVLNRPTTLPDIPVQRETGEITGLHSFDRPVLVVDLFFSRCLTACMAMGYRFSKLQSMLSAISQDIQFLSISFDHANDGPGDLAAYLHRFSADTENWSALRVVDKQSLDDLLDSLGVVVLPAPELGFIHNAAFYLVRDHEIEGIYDIEDTEQLVRNITDSLAES